MNEQVKLNRSHPPPDALFPETAEAFGFAPGPHLLGRIKNLLSREVNGKSWGLTVLMANT